MLSTPPAFILSQDQTLMLKFWFQSKFAWLILTVITVVLVLFWMFSWTSRLNQKPLFLEFSGFYILFNLQLSRISLRCQTCLLQRLFIITGCFSFVNNFFNLFFFLFFCLATAKYILSDPQQNVNNFLIIFQKNFAAHFRTIKGCLQAPLYTIFIRCCNPV